MSPTKRTRKKNAPNRDRFVEEYLIDLNATQAAIRAGYSQKSAYSQGQRLLKNAEIAGRIESAKAARSQRVEIDQDYVVRLLQEIAEKSVGRQKVTIAVKGTDVEMSIFDQAGANRAAELLGKHLGMFVERVGNPDGSPLLPAQVTVTLVKPGERRDP